MGEIDLALDTVAETQPQHVTANVPHGRNAR
jgi:hypothetical protein